MWFITRLKSKFQLKTTLVAIMVMLNFSGRCFSWHGNFAVAGKTFRLMHNFRSSSCPLRIIQLRIVMQIWLEKLKLQNRPIIINGPGWKNGCFSLNIQNIKIWWLFIFPQKYKNNAINGIFSEDSLDKTG